MVGAGIGSIGRVFLCGPLRLRHQGAEHELISNPISLQRPTLLATGRAALDRHGQSTLFRTQNNVWHI
jgi:hypothetical protein